MRIYKRTHIIHRDERFGGSPQDSRFDTYQKAVFQLDAEKDELKQIFVDDKTISHTVIPSYNKYSIEELFQAALGVNIPISIVPTSGILIGKYTIVEVFFREGDDD